MVSLKRKFIQFRSLLVIFSLVFTQIAFINNIKSQPKTKAQITPDDDFFYHTYDLHFEDGYVYLIDNNYIRLYNITSEYYFAYSGYEQISNLGEGAKLHVHDNIALVSDLIGNINIISCININNPNLILSFTITDFFDEIYDFELNNDFLYVLIEGYLKIFNMTVMSAPSLTNTYTNASLTFVDLVVSGNSLFLLSEEFGLSIFNITNPLNITEFGTYHIPGSYQNLELIGQTAFLTKNKNEIVAVNCIDPTNPQLLSIYNGNWETNYVELIQEDTNILVLKNKGFDIIDISDANNMTKLGTFSIDKDVQFSSIDASEETAYIGSYSNNYYQNVYIVDYKNPEEPVQLAPTIRPWYYGSIFYTILMLLGYALVPATIVGLVIFFIVRYVRRQKDEFKDIDEVAIKKEKKKLHEREW